jgi:hypothetical protein
MTAVTAILSLLLAAEFVFAPVNLWTGRTIGNFVRFTGLPPRFATLVLAPAKLATRWRCSPAWPSGQPASPAPPARWRSPASTSPA